MRKRRLQWYEHVCRREEKEDIRYVTNIKSTGKRKREAQTERWSETIKADMKRWDLNKDYTDDRARWYTMIELRACRTATRTLPQPVM